MTVDSAPQVDLEAWRGVAADSGEEMPASGSEFCSVARSRAAARLHCSGHTGSPCWRLLFLIVAENIASDCRSLSRRCRHRHRASPPSSTTAAPTSSGSSSPCSLIAAVIQAMTQRAFIRLSGRIGQDVVLDLRTRVFTHFQLLSQAFHEDYTSGRVIARQTSDIEAINEFLEDGVDNRWSPRSSRLGLIGITMLFLDVPLALVGFGFVHSADLPDPVVPAGVGQGLPASTQGDPSRS